MGLSQAERYERLGATIDFFERQDLRGAEFLRLLRRAQLEGLLDELLQEAVSQDRPDRALR